MAHRLLSLHSKAMDIVKLFMTVFLAMCALPIFTFGDDPSSSVCHPLYYHRPRCIDYPDGYGCRCGPGYVWNSQMCVAIGLDSRLEFLRPHALSYTVVLNKPFPLLQRFTIAMWVNIASLSKNRNSTLLSYSSGAVPNVLTLYMTPTLTMKVFNEVVETNIQVKTLTWTHLAWTQNASGEWRIYINGVKHSKKGRLKKQYVSIPAGGELVLGQSSRLSEGHFNERFAFIGSMAFVNIWNYVLSRAEVKTLYRDCTLTLCGNAIQWSDFRSGTRGGLRIKWPSFVYGKRSCFMDKVSGQICEGYCSKVNGAKCSAETIANVEWPRTMVGTNATVMCPGQLQEDNKTYEIAWRKCETSGNLNWKWLEPDVTECTSHDLLQLQNGVTEMSPGFIESNITEVTSLVKNVTSKRYITNPFDLSTVINTIDAIIKKQKRNVQHVFRTRETRTYENDRERNVVDHPDWDDTKIFLNDTVLLLESLLDINNIASWMYSKPQGNEGDHFLQTLDDLFEVLADSIHFHLKKGEISFKEAELESSSSIMNFSVKLYDERSSKDVSFQQIEVENNIDSEDENTPDRYILYPKYDILNSNHTSGTSIADNVIVTKAVLNISKLIPNHNIHSLSKEDNVNSIIVSLQIHQDKTHSGSRRNDLITTYLPYLETFNISNPECVQLVHGKGPVPWRWTRDGCVLYSHSYKTVRCQCNNTGWYTVTTDMYDVNWKMVVITNPLMEVPSYIGCLISSLLCLMSVCLLIYYKTTSKTASLHKQFGGSIVMVQVIFMIGINRTENSTLCHVFAIAFHYFFLSTFLWLMNEAFNLYIVITYAAHSHGVQPEIETGFDWRYFLLGWVLPGVLVGAMVGSHMEDYYASDMCWIAWQYIWLFIGPAIGIISVTVLVLIFTAKEHNESSYSKNKETNKMITLYSKSVWTQVILLTVCWAFAILSVRMMGTIIKWIYALFNSIQGAFFAVFYFWLNDEVRELQTEHRKRQQLNKSGYICSSNGSVDEHMELTQHQQEEDDGAVGSSAGQKQDDDQLSLLAYVRRRLVSSITEEKSETSSEDNNECQNLMLTTSL